MAKIGKIIEHKDKRYKIGNLVSVEDIVKLKEANEDALVYMQPCSEFYKHEEGVASVVVCDNRLEIKSLAKDSNGVPWKPSTPEDYDINTGRWLDIYELIHIYYGDEILKMIREGKLKEGDKLIAHEESYDINLVIHKNSNGTLHIKEVGTDNEDIDSWDLINMAFQLKQKKYLTFDGARKSGEKFKYKNWTQFQNLREVMLDLSTYDSGSISIMLNEKAWEIED